MIWVPGAVELSVVAQELAYLGTYDAVITFGAVIKGETDHYEYVCQHATHGCQIGQFGYADSSHIWCSNHAHTRAGSDRVGGKRGHHGREAAQAAMKMAEIMGSLKRRSSLAKLSLVH